MLSSLTSLAIIIIHLLCSGNFFYPKGAYREWHTNVFDPHGWRLYLVHTNPSGCSAFRYIHPHTDMAVQCHDFDGCLRLFKVGSDPLLWHSVVR